MKKAEERLHKAQAKAKETQEKVAKAQEKSSSSSRGGKGKASGKSSSSSSTAADLRSKSGGPPPKGGSSSGSSDPLVDTGASTNVAPGGFNPKSRVVVTGNAEPTELEQQPQWSPQQMLYLTQMWNMMQAQQQAGLSMADIQSAFLNGPMTGMASGFPPEMVPPHHSIYGTPLGNGASSSSGVPSFYMDGCPQCGALTNSSAHGIRSCTACEWSTVEYDDIDIDEEDDDEKA